MLSKFTAGQLKKNLTNLSSLIVVAIEKKLI